jgi:hypothetical protein
MSLDTLGDVFLYVNAFLGAFLAALWLSLMAWTYRDIRGRSRDKSVQVLATLTVGLLTLPGLLVYMLLRPSQTLEEKYQAALREEVMLAELEHRSYCPGCSAPVQQDWQVCPQCQTRLSKPCEHCGRLLRLPWEICPFCAAEVPPGPGRPIGSEASEDYRE